MSVTASRTSAELSEPVAGSGRGEVVVVVVVGALGTTGLEALEPLFAAALSASTPFTVAWLTMVPVASAWTCTVSVTDVLAPAASEVPRVHVTVCPAAAHDQPVPAADTKSSAAGRVSVSVSVPENDVPDCVSAHVIWPGPDESDAVPDHEPLTLAVVVEVEPDGVVGVEPPPPLHPTVTSATPRTAPARTPENRVRIMGNLADSSTAQFTQPERSTLL